MVDSVSTNLDSVCTNRFVLTEFTISIPGLLSIFLHGCEIKSGRGLGTRLVSILAHCKQSKAGGWEGLGMKLRLYRWFSWGVASLLEGKS